MDALLDRKSLLVSMLYSLVTFRRTPVILVNKQMCSHGRVPLLEEIRTWIEQAKAA
jgi:hypothetical protein